MGSEVVNRSLWSMGVQIGNISKCPIFAWGIGALTGKNSPLHLSTEHGSFILSLPRQEHEWFSTDKDEIDRLVKRLKENGLSKPPLLTEAAEILNRYSAKLEKDKIEEEWRELIRKL